MQVRALTWPLVSALQCLMHTHILTHTHTHAWLMLFFTFDFLRTLCPQLRTVSTVAYCVTPVLTTIRLAHRSTSTRPGPPTIAQFCYIRIIYTHPIPIGQHRTSYSWVCIRANTRMHLYVHFYTHLSTGDTSPAYSCVPNVQRPTPIILANPVQPYQ